MVETSVFGLYLYEAHVDIHSENVGKGIHTPPRKKKKCNTKSFTST